MWNPFRRNNPEPVKSDDKLDIDVVAINALRAKGTRHAAALADEMERGRQRRDGLPQHAPGGVISADGVCLHQLRGASFGPNAELILPSGTILSGNEAQIWTSLYGDTE